VLFERIRERLDGIDRRELIGLFVIGAIVVAAVGFWYVRSLPTRVRIEAAGGAGRPSAAAGGGGTGRVAGPSPSPPIVVVDVAGWVRRPGVYEMHQGDRVIDALQAAGGAKPGANLTSVNLAAVLSDAQQILVTKRGSLGSGAGGGPGGTGAAGGPEAKINLNTATLDQLETLPGIGEVLGQRVIDYREQHGPFHSVDDLLNVSGIGPSHLADIKDSVTV
jgi:competence protein ComEA